MQTAVQNLGVPSGAGDDEGSARRGECRGCAGVLADEEVTVTTVTGTEEVPHAQTVSTQEEWQASRQD